MTDVLAGISAALGSVTKLIETAKSMKDSKLELAIADLHVQLADIKLKIADLTNENAELKEQLRQRQEKPPVIIERGLYFTMPRHEGPYCPTCYGGSGKLIPLAVAVVSGRMAVRGKWHCNKCNGDYHG